MDWVTRGPACRVLTRSRCAPLWRVLEPGSHILRPRYSAGLDPGVRGPGTTRVRQLLGWEPTVSWADGLTRTITWFLTSAITCWDHGHPWDPAQAPRVRFGRVRVS